MGEGVVNYFFMMCLCFFFYCRGETEAGFYSSVSVGGNMETGRWGEREGFQM